MKKWLGSHNSVANRRSACVDFVASMGMRTPRQIHIIPDVTQAPELMPLGKMIVVKEDYTAGGNGVSIVSTPEAAIDVASRNRAKEESEFPTGAVVAQEYIDGKAASVSFSALRGRMLEGFAYAFVEQDPAPHGPASVIKIIDHPEIMNIARQIIEAFDYSGIGGMDFILPLDGGRPVFLELNARPTQTAHLGRLFGSDLCRALACAIAELPYKSTQDLTKLGPIALFPNEWVRDKNSPYLVHGYHDVPWHERRITAATIHVTPRLNPG